MNSYLQYRRIGQRVRQQLEQGDEQTAVTVGSSRSAMTLQQTSSHDAVRTQIQRDLQRRFEEAECEAESSDREGHDTPTPPCDLSNATQSAIFRLGVHVTYRATREEKNEKSMLFIVGWDEDEDPFNPHNWSDLCRVLTTLMIAAIAFVVTAASSIDSAILPQAAEEFGVSEVVENLATGMGSTGNIASLAAVQYGINLDLQEYF